MKKISLLFFTFLGICGCFGQQLPKNNDTVKILQSSGANSLPVKIEAVVNKLKPSAVVYPNPAKNKIEIVVKGFAAGYLKLQLLNNTGKLIREEKRLLLSGNEIIVFMFSEIPGFYYLLLKQGTQTLKNKLVIQ